MTSALSPDTSSLAIGDFVLPGMQQDSTRRASLKAAIWPRYRSRFLVALRPSIGPRFQLEVFLGFRHS